MKERKKEEEEEEEDRKKKNYERGEGSGTKGQKVEGLLLVTTLRASGKWREAEAKELTYTPAA